MITTRATVVDAKRGKLQTRVLPQIGQMVKASAPAGIFVDFLQGHDVGVQALNEFGDLHQIRAQLLHRAEALMQRKATGMSDIVGQKSQSGHPSNKIDGERSA